MPKLHRRAFRHAVDLRCNIVRERDFKPIASHVIDLSTDGMRVGIDAKVLTGERVLVSFRAPRTAQWIDVTAFVARVIHGRRPGERGRQLGLAFDGLDRWTRLALFRDLRSMPPVSRGATREERARRDRRSWREDLQTA